MATSSQWQPSRSLGLIFRLDRRESNRAEVDAARALLRAVKDQFFDRVGRIYFSTVYTDQVADHRARRGAGKPDQVYVVPRESIAAVLNDQRAVEARLVSPQTMVWATFALWQIDKLNELIRKQGMFNAVHAPDFFSDRLSRRRRKAVLQASVAISREVHRYGIGPARDESFLPFERSVDKDLTGLEARGNFWKVLGRNAIYIVGDLGFLEGWQSWQRPT